MPDIRTDQQKYIKTLTVDLNGSGKNQAKIGIIDGRGKHVTKAQTLMEGDPELWFPALMHVVCRVNDKQETLEFYREMRMGAFMAIMTELSDAGFTE